MYFADPSERADTKDKLLGPSRPEMIIQENSDVSSVSSESDEKEKGKDSLMIKLSLAMQQKI